MRLLHELVCGPFFPLDRVDQIRDEAALRFFEVVQRFGLLERLVVRREFVQQLVHHVDGYPVQLFLAELAHACGFEVFDDFHELLRGHVVEDFSVVLHEVRAFAHVRLRSCELASLPEVVFELLFAAVSDLVLCLEALGDVREVYEELVLLLFEVLLGVHRSLFAECSHEVLVLLVEFW